MEGKQLFFVYGTLRDGQGNNWLMKEVEGIRLNKEKGGATTVNKYKMYGGGIPFVVPDEHEHHIKGDVYEVEGKDSFKAIDGLEDHPNWYKRELIPVIIDGKEHQAWLYFNDLSKSQRKYYFEDGDFTNNRVMNETSELSNV